MQRWHIAILVWCAFAVVVTWLPGPASLSPAAGRALFVHALPVVKWLESRPAMEAAIQSRLSLAGVRAVRLSGRERLAGVAPPLPPVTSRDGSAMAFCGPVTDAVTVLSTTAQSRKVWHLPLEDGESILGARFDARGGLVVTTQTRSFIVSEDRQPVVKPFGIVAATPDMHWQVVRRPVVSNAIPSRRGTSRSGAFYSLEPDGSPLVPVPSPRPSSGRAAGFAYYLLRGLNERRARSMPFLPPDFGGEADISPDGERVVWQVSGSLRWAEALFEADWWRELDPLMDAERSAWRAVGSPHWSADGRRILSLVVAGDGLGHCGLLACQTGGGIGRQRVVPLPLHRSTDAQIVDCDGAGRRALIAVDRRLSVTGGETGALLLVDTDTATVRRIFPVSGYRFVDGRLAARDQVWVTMLPAHRSPEATGPRWWLAAELWRCSMEWGTQSLAPTVGL